MSPIQSLLHLLSHWLIADGCEDWSGFHYCQRCECWISGHCCAKSFPPVVRGVVDGVND